ncbi:hypothetical protein [Metapseudomonas otitidis]|uniref:hypothetical protein n=1 Tax=Metapseudomonas otitidis TaxID=319939 RepID=UPI0013DFE70E|nr:hypothetical protein [Pseudomonas otitidis]
MNRKTLIVLQRAYIEPFTVQSNYARENAMRVAELASRGLLTTHAGHGTYSKHWRVTPAGRALLEYTGGES